MATCTLALDSADSYRFYGHGSHPSLYEKWVRLTNYAGDLSSGQIDSYFDDLALFSWMRGMVSGGDWYRENPQGTRNYQAKAQAALMARLNLRAGPFRWMLTPYAPPSSTMIDGTNTMAGISSSQSAGLQAAHAAFNATSADWQAWTDQVDAQIGQAIHQGCNVEYLCSGNEIGVVSIGNFWQVFLSTSQALDSVRRMWLGQGVTGGGIASRRPWMRLIFDDAWSGNQVPEYRSAALADSEVDAAISLYGHHQYGTSSSIPSTAGIWTTHRGCMTEYGATPNKTSGYTSADARRASDLCHQGIVYARQRIMTWWTAGRDVVAKAANGGYTAKPTHDFTTASGTFARLPFWWALKPYLLACGKGEADVLRASTQTTDTNFDPRSGTTITAFHRTGAGSTRDGKRGIVYANFSGSAQSDTISFTTGGSPANLSGTVKTFAVMTGVEGSASAVATTGGSIALGSVPDATILLLELS